MKHARLYAKPRRPLLSPRFVYRFIVFCALLVATGVVYVWEQHYSLTLGYHIIRLQRSVKHLDRQRQKLEADLLHLKAPQHIKALIRQRGLNLQEAAAEQLVPVPLPRPLREPLEEDHLVTPPLAEGVRVVRR